MQQSGRHAANTDAWAQNVKEWEAHALRLEAQVANLKAQLAAAQIALAVRTVDAEGLRALKNAYAATHPQSPLLADSGKRYKDGDKKLGAVLYMKPPMTEYFGRLA